MIDVIIYTTHVYTLFSYYQYLRSVVQLCVDLHFFSYTPGRAHIASRIGSGTPRRCTSLYLQFLHSVGFFDFYILLGSSKAHLPPLPPVFSPLSRNMSHSNSTIIHSKFASLSICWVSSRTCVRLGQC